MTLLRVATALSVLWLLNILIAYWTNYPFVYCIFWQGIWSYVLHPVASLLVFAGAIIFFFAMIFGGVMSAVGVAVVMFLIGGADGFARALLTLPGNSCG